MSERGILVLGLHRGGTSALAGILYHLGVFMGDELLPPSEYNPRGYFEDRKFMKIHDRLIGDWKEPQLSVDSEILDEYAALIEVHSKGHKAWGVKDPRLCFTLPAFLRAWQRLGRDVGDLVLIRVYRDPWAAAESLYNRGGHTKNEALSISMQYLIAMLYSGWESMPRSNRFIIHYPRFVYGQPIDGIVKFCGLEPSAEQVEAAEEFLDPGLVHCDVSMETKE